GGGRDLRTEPRAVVPAEPVGHARCRDAVAIGERRVELDAIVRLRQVLADDRDGDGAIETLVVRAPVRAAPGHAVSDRAAVGRRDRREPAGHLERIAPDETAREIGLVELLPDDAAAHPPAIA